jgi:hypothetical protein
VKCFFFSCVFLLSYCNVFATGKDSSTLYKKYYGFHIQYVYANDFDHPISIDSSLSGFQLYNPATRNFGTVETGNLGYPAYSQIFSPSGFTDFDLGFHQFDPYLFSTENARYYYAIKPMTEIQYTDGSKGEKMLLFSHTQNIIRNWNVGLDFLLINSPGFYTHQKAVFTDVDFYTWYHGKKQHYNVFSTFVLNDMELDENGGVKSDSVFTDPQIFIKTLEPVRLDTAENFLRSYSFSLQQSWDFGDYTDIKINDSTTYKKLVPAFRIQDNITYLTSLYRYTDLSNDDSFYVNQPIDTSITQDSLRFKHFSNAIGFSILSNEKKFLPALFTNNQFSVFLHTDWYSIKQATIDTSFYTEGLQALYFTKTLHPNSVFYDLAGNYDVINFKTSIYKLAVGLGFAFSDSTSTISGAVSSYSTPPSFVATDFSSNYNNWVNNFNTEKIQTAAFAVNLPRWKTSFNLAFYNTINYVYWDYNAQPFQVATPVNAVVAYLQKDFKFFRNFHFNNQIVYQRLLSGGAYVHLPEFVSRQSLYYGNDLFKHALHTEIGVDVNYNTAFYVPAYMPESGQFYLQSSAMYPTYPVADFFVSIRVKSVRAFFKIANADQGVFEPGYFTALHYPMPDLSFVVGVNWTFRN